MKKNDGQGFRELPQTLPQEKTNVESSENSIEQLCRRLADEEADKIYNRLLGAYRNVLGAGKSIAAPENYFRACLAGWEDKRIGTVRTALNNVAKVISSKIELLCELGDAVDRGVGLGHINQELNSGAFSPFDKGAQVPSEPDEAT